MPLSFTAMLFGSLSLTLDYHVSQCALLIRVLYLLRVLNYLYLILFSFSFQSCFACFTLSSVVKKCTVRQ